MAVAQMNWGRLKYSLQDKRMAEFAASLNEVYALAENHIGFIWRISDNQSELELSNLGFNKLISSTLSVWKDLESLKDYTYNSLHGVYLKKSSNWFQKVEGPQLVVWNVKNDDEPTFKEAFERLEYFREKGPTDNAYAWSI